MKWLHRGSLLVLLLSLWLVNSCSHKAPATRLDRAKWNQATLNGYYDTIGSRNPKWDQDAREALSRFAEISTASADQSEILTELIGDATDNAVTAGCDDPMILSLHVRYSSAVHSKPLSDRQDLYRGAADQLENSPYPPIRKFYGNMAAAETLWQRRNTNLWQDVVRLRHASISDLTQALQEKSLPEGEAYDAATALFKLLAHNRGEITNAYNQIESALAHQSGKAAMADFIEAAFYVQYAWQARGHGTADQVTEEGWKLFHERNTLAQKALEHAWSRDSQDPQIPTLMISIVLSQEQGRPEMEKWFNRAMQIDTNNYAACRAKLNFLLPQWYGSRDDMLEFGRQCVASTNWAGEVPLTLVDAHGDFDRTLSGADREAYWTSPDVWPDIKAAYEKFAELNPDKTQFRYPYAWYAYHCGQTNDFVEQIQLIRKNDGEVRYAYFGGKDAFDQVWAQATGAAAPTNKPATGAGPAGH
jgi:hypothetical protein